MSKAFNPFYTTKPIGEGTGLGLSQVYGFVKQSGGHIKLYSEVGEGTTVKIYLPRLISDKHEEAVEPPSFEPHGKPDETILVVEDDADVRAYSTESLRDLGFTVLEAAEAMSALRLLDRHPEVQLVFTDVGLPGLNGRELIDKVRERRPLMRVLFTTGYARNAIVHHGRLDPGVELLTKPFTRAQLAVRVRTILDAKLDMMGRQKQVLVVEDEPLVLMFAVDSLTDSGFKVFEAATAAAAAKVAAEQNLDVAIIDLGLPDRNGMELAKELRVRWPHIKIIIASGFGEGVSGSLQEDPNVTFLGKPYHEEALMSSLKRLKVEP